MPRLSQLLTAPEAFPTQTGEPRATIATPVIALPAPPSGFGTDVGTALQQAGASISADMVALARQVRRDQHIQAQLQKAQDTLAATSADNEYRPALDTFEVQSRSDPDIAGHAGRLKAYDQALRQQVGRELKTPQAQQLFDVKAGTYYGQLNRTALDWSQKETFAQAGKIAEDAGNIFQEQVLQAETPIKQELALASYRETMQSFVDNQVLYPADAQRMIRTTLESVDDRQNGIWQRRDPERMLRQYENQAAGLPVDPTLPTAYSWFGPAAMSENAGMPDATTCHVAPLSSLLSMPYRLALWSR